MEVTPIQINDADQLEETVRDARRVFNEGGLIIFPTETVYGIGASAVSEEGFAALSAVKQRETIQPFTVHIPVPAEVGRYVDTSDSRVQRMANKLFPGPVTLIVEVSEDVQRVKVADMIDEINLDLKEASEPTIDIDPEVLRKRLYHEGTIGLRCPDEPLAQNVLASTSAPVVASSANQRGQRPPLEVDAAVESVGQAAAMIIDGGRCRYAKPSTIVNVRMTEHGPVVSIEREGVYDERTIRRALRWNLLLLCSGNTCRSPMAEGIARSLLAEQRGIDVTELKAAGVGVMSAGTFAGPGMPAAGEAVQAMSQQGIDLSSHRSQPLTPQLIRDADVIYTMTGSHRDAVLSYDPTTASKVFTLDPNGDIDDPIGGNLSVYQKCAERIRQHLDARLKEHQP